MNLTSLHISRLAAELKDNIIGAKISGLKKSEKDKIILIQFSGDGGKYTLEFHFGGSPSFLFLRNGFSKKIATTNFLPQLLEGIVSDIRQINFDRIIEIGVAGDDEEYRLIFELFGISSNLYLTNSSYEVITSIRKARLDLKKYQPPELSAVFNPLDFDMNAVTKKLGEYKELPFRDALARIFTGLDLNILDNQQVISSPDFSCPVGEIPDKQIVDILEVLRRRCISFTDSETSLVYDRRKQNIQIAGIISDPGTNSLSAILCILAERKKTAAPQKSETEMVRTEISRTLKKEQKKIAKLEEQYSTASTYPELQKQAELLSINLHRMRKGMKSVDVPDIYSDDEKTVKIELDETLGPGQNVERIFQRAKKLRDKMPGISQELEKTIAYVSQLNDLLSKIENSGAAEIPEELSLSLNELGLRKKLVSSKKPDETPERVPYRRYFTSMGEAVLVGKSAKDNDILTFRIARKNDLWLHSQQTAGSHVILKRPNRTHQFQKSSIIEAAEIAAFYSSAKNSESVPVIYTEAKYVRKPRKGSPGQVLADHSKSILVKPRRPQN